MTDITTESLWQAYTEIRSRAERSGRLEDGIAAGKAWARFLAAFIEDDKKAAPKLEVISGGRQ